MADAQLSFIERLITDKKCTKCGCVKPLESFHKLKKGVFGRRSRCRACYHEYMKPYLAEYARKNPEKLRDLQAKFLKDKPGYNSERTRAFRKRNPERSAQQTREYRQRNPEKTKDFLGKWRDANKERSSKVRKVWASNNKAPLAAKASARRSLKLSATPKWADDDAIKQFYLHAELLTKSTGIVHEVDHIIPLKHPLVCGLHCESNLQVITADENRFKGNKYPYSRAEYLERCNR